MIIALAGRRIDAEDAAAPRFPLQNMEMVRRRIRDVFQAKRVAALVSSAACGVDLIAQSEAGALGLRRRIVLPFERERFLQSSVIDRPGDWAEPYNRLLDAVSLTGDLVLLPGTLKPADAFAAANLRIIDEAEALANTLRQPLTALLVWDGSSRGADDVTWGFGEEARKRGHPVIEAGTL